MKKSLLIFSIVSALVAGFLFGKGQSQPIEKELLTDKSDYTSLLDEIKETPSKELYEKLFLLLLAEIGLKNYSFDIEIPVQEKIVEIEKKVTCPAPVTIVNKSCPNTTEKKTTKVKKKQKKKFPPFRFDYLKNINELYKKSYVLTKPIDIPFGTHTFRLKRKSYDSDRYILELESRQKHDGKKWSGKIEAIITSEAKGELAKLEATGVNTKFLLAPTDPESVFLDLKQFVIHFQNYKSRHFAGAVYIRKNGTLKPWGITVGN